jgi:hypothetical protein
MAGSMRVMAPACARSSSILASGLRNVQFGIPVARDISQVSEARFDFSHEIYDLTLPRESLGA